VEEGHVRVRWPGDATELRSGESGLFPPELPAASPEPTAPPEPSAQPTATRVRESNWRELAREGDFDRAYKVLARSGPPRDEPAELLLAADVARLSKHPREAVVHLRKLLLRHRRDPRAQLAAFTLGRILLDELGQPNEAAAAFADAEKLAPGGVLAEDAIAREVEAWSRAGQSTRAQHRAEEYLRRYPHGGRIRSVRRFGGLE
jgi:transmembrane sensor